MVNWFDRL